MGFDRAIIATDHGFLLLHEQQAGDLAPRPSGTWLLEKSRCMLGKGEADAFNLVMKRGEVGISGDFEDYAAPKTLVPYERGKLYYHEGLSLQECVLPCLTVRLEAASTRPKKSAAPNLTLSYRQGKTTTPSRRPVVDLSWAAQSDLFIPENEIEVVVEAVDSRGNVVGSVSSGDAVNPATGGIRIRPGLALAVGLRMSEEFSGTFTVRVLDPATHLLLASLTLKTGYLE
jgi:hypothetical protein